MTSYKINSLAALVFSIKLENTNKKISRKMPKYFEIEKYVLKLISGSDKKSQWKFKIF